MENISINMMYTEACIYRFDHCRSKMAGRDLHYLSCLQRRWVDPRYPLIVEKHYCCRDLLSYHSVHSGRFAGCFQGAPGPTLWYSNQQFPSTYDTARP